MDCTIKYPLGEKASKPEQLDEMVDVAETLGSEFDFVRGDLYQPNGEEVIFGEMTAAPGSGLKRFFPKEFDFKLGSHWL